MEHTAPNTTRRTTALIIAIVILGAALRFSHTAPGETFWVLLASSLAIPATAAVALFKAKSAPIAILASLLIALFPGAVFAGLPFEGAASLVPGNLWSQFELATSTVFGDLFLVALLFATIELMAATDDADPPTKHRALAARIHLLILAVGIAAALLHGVPASINYVLPGAALMVAATLVEIRATLARSFTAKKAPDQISFLLHHGPAILVGAMLLITLGSFTRRL